MRIALFAIVVALIAATLPGHAQSPDSAIASIVNVSPKGRIWIKTQSNPKWESNAKNWQLCAGDSVKTATRTSATILYCDGRTIQLGRNQRHRVAMLQRVSFTSKLTRVLKWAFNQEMPLAQGASRGADKPPVLIYPRYGKILSDRPAFAWLSSSAGTDYQLQLFNADDSLVWSTTQKDTVCLYPTTAPPLMANAAYQLEINRKHKNSAEDYGNFSLASNDERTAMDSLQREIQNHFKSGDRTVVTADIVYAAALKQEEYFTEALLVLQQALKKQPDNRTIRTMLAQIYEQVGPPVLTKPMLK